MSYLDLRDLAEEYDGLKERRDDPDGSNPLDEDDEQRISALADLDKQLFSGLAEYADNEPTAIAEDEFEDYAQELADDLGYARDSASNPLMGFIDWEGWAESLKVDYTEVTFEGDTYLIRAY